MDAFKQHTGIVATLDTANIDTDQIIAKQFLKSIKRTGFGEHLFHDWRYDTSGKANKDFSLNRPEFQGASVLVARNNFGCGSSREHAVWAVLQYGFHVVIAPSKISGDTKIPGFADIFRNNSGKNGLLTIELTESEVDQIFKLVDQTPGIKATIDLEKQTIVLNANEPVTIGFEVDASLKNRLLHGLDDIALTLQQSEKLSQFEAKHNAQLFS